MEYKSYNAGRSLFVGRMKLPNNGGQMSYGGLWIMSELRTNKIYPRDGLVSGANGGIVQIMQH